MTAKVHRGLKRNETNAKETKKGLDDMVGKKRRKENGMNMDSPYFSTSRRTLKPFSNESIDEANCPVPLPRSPICEKGTPTIGFEAIGAVLWLQKWEKKTK